MSCPRSSGTADYLDEEAFHQLQLLLMRRPDVGDPMVGTGGLRKVRFPDERRGQGKRGGLRVIYYWWAAGPECWLFTVYDKDEMADLTGAQRNRLRSMLEAELRARRTR